MNLVVAIVAKAHQVRWIESQPTHLLHRCRRFNRRNVVDTMRRPYPTTWHTSRHTVSQTLLAQRLLHQLCTPQFLPLAAVVDRRLVLRLMLVLTPPRQSLLLYIHGSTSKGLHPSVSSISSGDTCSPICSPSQPFASYSANSRSSSVHCIVC